MRSFLAISLIFIASNFVFGQYAQAPILEKEINFKDWTYKDIRSGKEQNLREFTVGKKLVMVVYYAPWCHDWAHDAPMLQKLHEKYQNDGLGIIAVGLYDPVEKMKANLDAFKITFPAVYESAERSARQKSLHFQYRRSTGDLRDWGSPWFIFLPPSVIEKEGETLTKKTFIINGEMVETDGERFIRKQLGLPEIEIKKTVAKKGEIEACDQ